MGYVATDPMPRPAPEIGLLVRGKTLPAHVAKMPIVPQRYFRG